MRKVYPVSRFTTGMDAISLEGLPEILSSEEMLNQISIATGLKLQGIKSVITLMGEGGTVPFIARYRKDQTGGLDENNIRAIRKSFDDFLDLAKRKEFVLSALEKQGIEDEILKKSILEADSLARVEDLYLPYKPKLKTRGAKAKEQGLQPLAELVKEGKINDSPEEIAKIYINEEKGIKTIEDALEGAMDIIAEETSSDPDIRQHVRESLIRSTTVKTSVDEDVLSGKKKVVDEQGKPVDPEIFHDYFEFDIDSRRVKAHQVMALDRAETLGILNLSLETPDNDLIREIQQKWLTKRGTSKDSFYQYYSKAVENGYKRYIIRAMKRERWSELVEKAEDHAINVFAKNLRNLLMTPPLINQAIIGIDPGFRTGCKVAVIDQYGNFKENSVIYPFPPKNYPDEAEKILLNLANKYDAWVFSIGNGTASRESEQFIAAFIKKYGNSKHPFKYTIVSEAGASVYSVSELAQEEFPDLDPTVRGAISIARRLQDPLSELIKIDPKSIGVGMYQHDVNQKQLKEKLSATVEDCVHSVGIDVNTASIALLSHVSGLSKTIAKKVVEFRKKNGPFESRKDYYQVKGLGDKTFEQCAGFLRIREANDPMDRTFLHPESYEIAKKIMESVDVDPESWLNPKTRSQAMEKLMHVKPKSLSTILGVEPDTIRFLVNQLIKPDLDPRSELEPPALRQDILKFEDLKEGMIVNGTIRNVIDFGAFVDIGVKHDGLVHKSEIADKFIENPHEYLSVGDQKEFVIIGLDSKRHRISLSLKQVSKKK